MPVFSNAAAYKFVSLEDLPNLRESVRRRCRELELKGTILLSHEGINLFIAGLPSAVDDLLGWLRAKSEFSDLEVKISTSDDQPFNRMLVKIKREIISFGVPAIDPARDPAPRIRPEQLKQWLDEGHPIQLLDVRNNYEIAVGTFAGALPVGIDHFRQFPAAVSQLPLQPNRPIVMFCTGGIRCEKAAPFMRQHGFDQVFHLDGGILKYFEQVGGSHYNGECFVFDKRVALDPNLEESATTQCFACQAILSAENLLSPNYQRGRSCPHCFVEPTRQIEQLIKDRQRRIAVVTSPLPGSVPYDNLRPLNVAEKYDGYHLIEFLTAPSADRSTAMAGNHRAGRIQCRHEALAAEAPVPRRTTTRPSHAPDRRTSG